MLVALTLGLTALPATAGAQPADTLGVYAGAGAPEAVARFESRIGRPVAVVHDNFSKESWSALTDVGWWLSQWGPTKYAQRVVYTVPMLPNSGGTLAEGAAGAYNEHFRLLALKLVAGGAGNATLRLGPEFNGNWFKWTIAVPNGGADFAAYWRQIVTTMRSVPGANFKFDWCPNGGSSYVDGQQLRAEAAWPGDPYVDYVGLDVYDQSWAAHRRSAKQRWKEFLNQKDGLKWHARFAAAHRKPMSFPEWGLVQRRDSHGGGDNPYFVEQMYEWIRTNDIAYHMYFEYADSVADYAIFGGRAPSAARRFVELFGGGATGASLESLGGTPAASGRADGGASTSPRKTTAKKTTAKKTAAKKRCVTRVLRIRGKVVRKKGKVVRRTTCAKIRKAGRSSRRLKVSKRKTGAVTRVSARSTSAAKTT
ncbi:MAG: hypothetical protein KY463_13065 [Actinobacteria bacterium]|nr:hypothetical protein [Actinomycetota bacterium]